MVDQLVISELRGARIRINGIVQGVGFRPFVFGLATRLSLTGWVRNSSSGVDIEAEGSSEALHEFLQSLRKEAPPLASIDGLHYEPIPSHGYQHFNILNSLAISGAFQPISPDVSICPDCYAELFDPQDRRYRYPFINCTNCGPRFTIISDLPYDRPNTTMEPFEMCRECASEYNNPLDRRFHAQPVACPACGPQIWLEINDAVFQEGPGQELPEASLPEAGRIFRRDEAIHVAKSLIAGGKIIAIKGLGGFHLACDATNAMAVSALRDRKFRADKPFALMMADLGTVEAHCQMSAEESEILQSRERPIVILKRDAHSNIALEACPGQDTLGVMLPYTPLHYLLLAQDNSLHESRRSLSPNGGDFLSAPVLIMTSGNYSEEPLAIDNDEAKERLASIADAFLMHDRPIRTRADDSVVRVVHIPSVVNHTPKAPVALRRSRGYAPVPIKLPWNSRPALATGGELKNTFCLTRGQYAFLSHHIGDLQNYETFCSFEAGVEHFQRLFRIQPEVIAYDLHPDYLATRYALDRAAEENITAIGVQHHHAHIAACMAEHGFPGDRPVIGIAFDGTGYGDDNTIWGGEILLTGYREYRRLYHLSYVPMPGGDRAIKEPWRVALSWLAKAGIPWDEDLPPVNHLRLIQRDPDALLGILSQQIHTGINAPLTSSMGRLFDAVSSLIGLRQVVNYEAQAAIDLEQIMDPDEEGSYSFSMGSTCPRQIDPSPLILGMVKDYRSGVAPAVISARFHNGIRDMIHQICVAMRKSHSISDVVLTGGVWQNVSLLESTLSSLAGDNFNVLCHAKVPANDGGLALGQAAVATFSSI